MNQIYTELILDLNKNPKNFGKIDHDRSAESYNSLCGDRVKIYLKSKDNIIEDISFSGEGCAISKASASLLTEYIKGKSFSSALKAFDNFIEMIRSGKESELGKLNVFSKMGRYPSRVKCATLCWHTLKEAISRED